MIVKYSLAKIVNETNKRCRYARSQRRPYQAASTELKQDFAPMVNQGRGWQPKPVPVVRMQQPAPPRSARDGFIYAEIQRNARSGRYRSYSAIAGEYDRQQEMAKAANAAVQAAEPQ